MLIPDSKIPVRLPVKWYFDNNISVEIYTITSDKLKKENFDLIRNFLK